MNIRAYFVLRKSEFFFTWILNCFPSLNIDEVRSTRQNAACETVPTLMSQADEKQRLGESSHLRSHGWYASPDLSGSKADA